MMYGSNTVNTTRQCETTKKQSRFLQTDPNDMGVIENNYSIGPKEVSKKLAVAIIIPAAIIVLILIFTCFSCICCRPRNEDLMRFQNEMIDPLREIDKSKIRHWTYIQNNIPGSISAQGTALMSWGQPQTNIVTNGMPMMMGPAQFGPQAV